MKRVVILWLFLSLASGSYAELQNYGVNSASLNIGVGARATGMGGAFVALADDATAGYWNPAGLGQMELDIYQAAFQYAYLPHDMSTSFISYAFLWPDVGEFSLAWINFSIGQIDTFDKNQNMLNQTSSSENGVLLSYGRKVFEWVKGLSLGGTVKILHHHIDDFTGLGYGLDVGAIWQPILYLDHTIGINVQNLFQQLSWKDSSNDVSDVNFKAGTALKFFSSDDVLYFHHLIQTIDIDVTSAGRFGWHAGAEFWYNRTIGIRGGFDSSSQDVTIGASYRPDYYEIAYAFHYNLTEINTHQHRVSLLFRFQDKSYLNEQ